MFRCALIKTAFIAAVGIALASSSPAFAAQGKRADARAQAYAADVGTWQVQLEYLKDAPTHNGNNY